MEWDMESNFSNDNMRLKLRAFPCHGEAKYHAKLRISWFSSTAEETGTTFIERTYDGGLDVLNTDLELQRCRLSCDIFDAYPHVRALGIFARWGDSIVRFSNDAILAAKGSCSLGVELWFEMQVLQPAQATPSFSARRKGRHSGKSEAEKFGENGDYKKEDCAICWDSLGGKDPAVWTRCAHVFHSSCLRKWLRIKKTCPLCRAIVR